MTEDPSPLNEPLSEPSLAVKFVRRFVLPLGVVVLCALGAAGLAKLRGSAARDKPAPQVPLVQVIVSRMETLPAHVRATGNVEAARELNLIPEVSGRVTYVSPNLVTGGRVKKGETLVRIDGSTYALQAREQQSQVRKAESDLKLEHGRQEIAKQEWELIGDGRPASEADLPLRKPQLDSAKWNLDAAESSLKRARLNLSRTSIRAPMDAVVVSEQVERGQVVAPGFQIGSLMGVEQFWCASACLSRGWTTSKSQACTPSRAHLRR